MSKRVSPIERVRADIDCLFASDRELGEILEEVARLDVRLLMQTALEAEVTEFLGRERYVRGDRAREGSRNGHCPTTIKTTSGPITLERPKLRDADEQFASRLLGVGVCRTNALESLVITSFVRGLSVRDVEATLAEALGSEAALSKSTVSRICEAIKDEFESWRGPGPVGRQPRLPLPRQVPLQVPPGGSGRAGAVRLGHHHRGGAGVRWAGPRGIGELRRLGRLPLQSLRSWPHRAPAGHLRRGTGADRCSRGGSCFSTMDCPFADDGFVVGAPYRLRVDVKRRRKRPPHHFVAGLFADRCARKAES